jgi:hypothetical protein
MACRPLHQLYLGHARVSVSTTRDCRWEQVEIPYGFLIASCRTLPVWTEFYVMRAEVSSHMGLVVVCIRPSIH